MKAFSWLWSLVLVACGRTPAQPPAHAQQPHQHHQHQHQGGAHHRFTNADEWAPMFDDPARDEWQQPDKVVAALALAPGMIVADVGAGTGYFSKRLSTAVGEGGKVIAVDIEADMVRYLKERAQREGTANVEARLGAADDPKLGTASVDRILIVDTWHHITERVAYGKKLVAALRPGGLVYVVDFKLDSKRGPPPSHRLAPERVLEDLTAAGLRASVVDVGLPDQYVIKASL